MIYHPNITPASPSHASPLPDASFDSAESHTTTFTSPVVPTLETTTVTEVALGYHRNQQYSITAMTTSIGAVAERYAYTAYGQPTILNASGTVLTTSAVGNRYTYTGREWDETLGLHHFRARWMSPLAGRFLGRDPIGYEGSEWGLYEFVDSKPIISIDPAGLFAFACQCKCVEDVVGEYNGKATTVEASTNEEATQKCNLFCKDPLSVGPNSCRGTLDPLEVSCSKIKCPNCTPFQCFETLSQLKDAAKNTEIPLIDPDWTSQTWSCDQCDRWAVKYKRVFPKKITNKGCISSYNEIHWSYCIFGGHVAIKITLCDGTIFFVDNGWTGGPDRIFLPDEVASFPYMCPCEGTELKL